MRILAAFITLILYLSCKSSKNDPESTQDFLKNKFGYIMDWKDHVDPKSYRNDTSDTYIRSFIVLNSQHKFPIDSLKKIGFQEIQRYIDTIEEYRNGKLTLRYSANEISERLTGDVFFPVPIDTILTKNLLMKKVKLKVHEYKLVFYDTLSNKTYFYRHEFYKSSIF